MERSLCSSLIYSHSEPVLSSRSSMRSSRLFSEVRIFCSSVWYSVISAPDSSSVSRMLFVVALSVSLVLFSSGISESLSPVSFSRAVSAASVLGSIVPRSLISCWRTALMPEIPLDIVPMPFCMDCMVSSMLLMPEYRLSPESLRRSLTSFRSEMISSEDRVAGVINMNIPMFSKLSEPIRTVNVLSSPGIPMNTTSL